MAVRSEMDGVTRERRGFNVKKLRPAISDFRDSPPPSSPHTHVHLSPSRHLFLSEAGVAGSDGAKAAHS